MRNVLLLVFLSIFHHGMAQDLPGTLIGETYLSFQTSFNTVSIAGCEIGQAHLLVVSGTYGVANGSCDRDAAFMNFDNPEPVSSWVWNDICNGCQNNRPTPDAYNAYHVYSFPFEAVSSEQLFHFQDNGGAGDNCGGLSLAIYLLGTPGCTDPTACNFDLEASSDDGSCVPSGCMETEACNFNELAECEGEECVYSCCPGPGCCGEGMFWDYELEQCQIFETCQEDLDGDGVIGINDLMELLSSFGTMCEEPETVEFNCGDAMNYHGYDYATVQIGEQCWFAENCRYLLEVSPASLGFEDDSLAHAYVYGYEGSSVSEAVSTENYALHGVLYNQLAAETWDVCPTDWHVPFDSNIPQQGDFEELKLSLSADAAGTALKSSPTDVLPWDGSNSSGFTAIPSGTRSLYWDGEFSWLGTKAFFWSQTGNSRRLDTDDVNLSLMGLDAAWGLSVRCLKDSEE